MKSKILIVAVHPDDETLGAGGALLKHKAQGDHIHWLICTSLDQSHPYYEEREREIARVSSEYGFDGVHRMGLRTMRVDEYSMSDLVGRISGIFSEVKPSVVYLPFKGDVHSDHRKIFEAAFACTKSFRYPSIKRVLMVETLSETEFAPATKEDAFVPNVFTDISEHMDKKIEIMRLYSGEIAEHPFPRSADNMRALAMLRGATAGSKYAESFVLLKEVS